MSSLRLKVYFGVILLLNTLVAGRLFYWQIVFGEKLAKEAQSQYFQEEEIPAQRGKILASDGFPLATNIEVYLLYANLPKLEKSPQEISRLLEKWLFLKKEDLEAKLSRQDLVWVPLARKVEQRTKEEIESLKIVGLGFEKETKRVYPEASMAAHLLGFVGKEAAGSDKGYFGLEGFYQRSLSGQSGFLLGEKDPHGLPILIGKRSEDASIPGRDLELFLDRRIQFLIEEKLKEGIKRYEAKAGTVIVMDPQTGGILAMAAFPNFEATNYPQYEEKLFLNPAISQTFEPGSIFKPLVMAAALNQKVITLKDRCPFCHGPRMIADYTIRTWDDRYYPDSTVMDILVHSDNVGMTFVSEKLGIKNLVSYLRKFGFDRQTGIDLEGEAVPFFREEKDWLPIDLATASFGQGVAVTPMQMVRAMSVIANGGELVEPHVVARIRVGERVIEIKPKKEGRVISQASAKVVTEMMVQAAERGGKWKRPTGFRIAGKTGTAQIPIAGHYDQEKTIVSFIGFAPADEPRFVMLISLREPVLTWGGRTAAPLWFEIAEQIFFYLGILPR